MTSPEPRHRPPTPDPWSYARRYWPTPRAYKALGIEAPRQKQRPLTLGEWYAKWGNK